VCHLHQPHSEKNNNVKIIQNPAGYARSHAASLPLYQALWIYITTCADGAGHHARKMPPALSGTRRSMDELKKRDALWTLVPRKILIIQQKAGPVEYSGLVMMSLQVSDSTGLQALHTCYRPNVKYGCV
jgi:hypothetical protein